MEASNGIIHIIFTNSLEYEVKKKSSSLPEVAVPSSSFSLFFLPPYSSTLHVPPPQSPTHYAEYTFPSSSLSSHLPHSHYSILLLLPLITILPMTFSLS
jgi:hypothetical protein